MKLALVFLAVLPLVLSGPVEEKRFLEFLQPDSLVQTLESFVNSSMTYPSCVSNCLVIAGPMGAFCGTACIKALAAVGK